MASLERRAFREASAEGSRLSGYAAVFRSASLPLPSPRGEFVETIEPGAFRRSLAASTVWAFYGHDETWPLARTPDTLALREDSRGLAFDLTLPDTTQGRDVRELLAAGVLDGAMSFGFRTKADKWERRDGVLHRTLLDVDLVEVSIVKEAAYPAATSALRGQRSLATARRRVALLQRVVGGNA